MAPSATVNLDLSLPKGVLIYAPKNVRWIFPCLESSHKGREDARGEASLRPDKARKELQQLSKLVPPRQHITCASNRHS